MAPNNNKKNFKNEPKTPITNDPRFSRVHNDPRFVRPKKKDMKVTIDKRFASMMTSKEFSSGPRVDKYGRRLDQDTAEKELKRFYELDEQESDDDYSDEDKTVEQLEKELAADEENLRDEESEEESEEEDLEATKKFYDPMRGRGEISSSDEDDTDASDVSEEEDEENEEVDSVKHIPEGEETSRLALVNMDWDKIKAIDILKVLNGFKPDTGVIHRVVIYPSEFGKERLKQEETQGPPSEIFKTSKSQENDSESDDDEEEEITAETMIKNQLEEGDGQDFDQDALRKYQLDRLKYYYAVIECDSPQTAKVIYKTCDNTEYESSANFFDLRYIPDDMTFDDEPKEVATVAPENYTPSKFQTDALRRTKVSLTWDEDDVDRYQVTRREFTKDDLKDLDFDIYLASSDDDEDEEEDLDALREKYKKLLGGSKNSAFEDKVEENEDEEEGEMEITFTPGLSEAAGALVANKEEKDEAGETSIQAYLRKQKEKRKAKKAAKQQTKEQDASDASDMDEETANDPFFKEAMAEMEDEGLVDDKKKKKDKKSKKRASKEEREQKARERAELELLMDDDGKGEGFNMKEVLKQEKMEKKKKKKGKKVEEQIQTDDFEIDVQDPRFAAVQESHHFAIDPTNPQFKKTKSMQKLMNARQQKMKESHVDQDEWKKSTKISSASAKSEQKSSSSLDQLVASVKRKGALDKSNAGKRQKK
ncbi:pre-rRNA processing protein Esf1 [Choanephora cucurbitarum]|nr:pre-rRNA processing protein Esf1 [Choanephora cucurbitarum]